MFSSNSLSIERAQELAKPPSKGQAYSVSLPGTKVEGRSAVYRHWRFKDELLSILDPAVRKDTGELVVGHELMSLSRR